MLTFSKLSPSTLLSTKNPNQNAENETWMKNPWKKISRQTKDGELCICHIPYVWGAYGIVFRRPYRLNFSVIIFWNARATISLDADDVNNFFRRATISILCARACARTPLHRLPYALSFQTQRKGNHFGLLLLDVVYTHANNANTAHRSHTRTQTM